MVKMRDKIYDTIPVLVPFNLHSTRIYSFTRNSNNINTPISSLPCLPIRSIKYPKKSQVTNGAQLHKILLMLCQSGSSGKRSEGSGRMKDEREKKEEG